MVQRCTRLVHYPRNEGEMRTIMSSFFHEDVDSSSLRFAARIGAGSLKKYGEVIFLLPDNDPLVFRVCHPGSHKWRQSRTKEEKAAWYAKVKGWKKKKKKKTKAVNISASQPTLEVISR